MAIFLTSPIVKVLVGLCLLLLLILNVGGNEIIAQIKGANVTWGLVAAGCILLSTTLGGINLFLLMDTEGHPVKFSRFFSGYWFAWALGLIIPGGIGDILAVSAWLKRHGIEWHTGMGKALLDKLISLFWLIGLALFGITDTAIRFETPISLSTVLMMITLLIIFLVLTFTSRQGLKANRFIRRTMATVGNTIKSRPKQVAINALLTPIKVVILFMSYWCMFSALGASELDPIRVTALAAAAGLVAYIPVSFNGLGTVEAAGLLLFGGLSVSHETILGAYLMLRVTVLCLAWIPVGIWWLLARP